MDTDVIRDRLRAAALRERRRAAPLRAAAWITGLLAAGALLHAGTACLAAWQAFEAAKAGEAEALAAWADWPVPRTMPQRGFLDLARWAAPTGLASFELRLGEPGAPPTQQATLVLAFSDWSWKLARVVPPP